MNLFCRYSIASFLIVNSVWLGMASVSAQSKKAAQPKPKLATLALKARSYGDSIVLRWGVDQGAYWLIANQRGYMLDRIQYIPGQAKPVHKLLTVTPLKPWPLDSMKKRLRRDDRYAAVAAQLLYGKTYTETAKDEAVGFYKAYQEQQGKLLMAAVAADFSAGAASALALRFVDRTFDKQAVRCVYRLWINNGPKPRPNDLTDTVTVSVTPWRIDTLAAPKVATVESGDGVLKLRWYKYANGGAYSGYYIERSEDGKTYKRLNAVPYVQSRPDTLKPTNRQQLTSGQVEYTDSIKVNYRKFYYRIIGVSSFADLSPASKPLVGSGRDLTPPLAPAQLTKQIVDNRRIVLNWEMPKPSPDLKGFVVARAADINGSYQPLTQTVLPVTARTFTDEKPLAYYGRYYVVAAVDTAGNLAYSLPIAATIADKTPPAPPRGLRISVDTNGVATLRWPGPTEADVIGYKVYRAYQRDDKFYQQRTPLILTDTMYTDTLPTRSLTRQAYYKLVAIDLTNNYSDFSEPIEVAIPDKIPPATPIIKAISVTDQGVRLDIVPSLSSDVVEHAIYRRQPDRPWQLVRKLTGAPQMDVLVVDSSAVHQSQYEYSVLARDAGGRQSARSFIVPITYVNLKQLALPAPTGLRAVYDPQRKAIRVDWAARPPAGKYHFVVYRTVNNEGLSLYKSTFDSSLNDEKLSQSGRYTYAVRLVSDDRQSILSSEITVDYQK
ncbi:fibronectin type III domain-containing protein [Spirosoma migulaei]